jgi:cytochrome c oxidase cbb3-type subunit 4
MNYEALRHFADSYGLALMAVVYLFLCGWAFRPGARDRSRRAAALIFKDSDHG